ncbi:hypothetical protein N7486_004693 [Penicillium sp. IBT 16267x]|nr:hypothetical protein N7486_004693 [Penicillium sp. IBT 16267x]
MPSKVLTQANMDFLWACLETLPMPEWNVVAGKIGVSHAAAYTRFYRLRAYYAAQKKKGKGIPDAPSTLTPTGTTKRNAGGKLAQDTEAGDNSKLDQKAKVDEKDELDEDPKLDEIPWADESEDDVV